MRQVSLFRLADSTASFANFLQATAGFFTSTRIVVNFFQVIGFFLQVDFASTNSLGQAALEHVVVVESAYGNISALRLSVVCGKINQKSDNCIVLIERQFFDSADLEVIEEHFHNKNFIRISVMSHIAN